MNTSHAIPLLTTLALLTACHPSSLAAGENLEELMGVQPLPTDPGAELRWFGGRSRGLEISCELAEVELGDEEAVLGTASVDLFDEPEPPRWLHTEDYQWAVALIVLVDRQRYEGPGLDEEESLEETPGVWGIASHHALLLVDGDLEAAQDQLVVQPDEAEPLEDVGWVEILPAVIDANDSFVGGMSLLTGPLSEDHEGDEDLLPVTNVHWVEDELALRLFSGEALVGAQMAEGCE